MLYNNHWVIDETVFLTEGILRDLIKNSDVPKTPDEKRNLLFLKLFEFQKFDGQEVSLNKLNVDLLVKILYFKTRTEFYYYAGSLRQEGYVFLNSSSGLTTGFDLYTITFKGLQYQIELTKEGKNSSKCFVAMSFNADLSLERSAIKLALEETNFVPIIIDEQNIPSDRTINDEIISNLRICNFCIADFTFNSAGVYFESGFALGQGKKVIYTCRKEEFSNAHFDIKPLQHILYKSPEQLKKDLINKINAWII